jgi:hypothetical protein
VQSFVDDVLGMIQQSVFASLTGSLAPSRGRAPAKNTTKKTAATGRRRPPAAATPTRRRGRR